MNREKFVITWAIHTLNRAKHPPLPLEIRFYLLNWPQLSPEQDHEIRSIIAQKRITEPRHVPSIGEIAVEVNLRPRGPNPRYKAFRQFFTPVTPDDIQRELSDRNVEGIYYDTINFGDNYIEDDFGKVITMQDVMDYVAGGPTLIMSDASSLLRIGPVPIIHREAWTTEKSNTVKQFLRIIVDIHKSDWMRAPVSFTTVTTKEKEIGHGQVIQSLFPFESEIYSVVPGFRQLFSNDELFNKACNIHLQHIGHHGKRAWLSNEKKQFNDMRHEKPGLPPHVACTRQELFELLAYGARIMHSEPAKGKDSEERLVKLINQHGRENIVFAINSALRDILAIATLAYHCIRQDYEHWVRTGSIPPPTSINMVDLMKSDRT